MNEIRLPPPCEVCGEPTTNMSHDLKELEPKDGWACWEHMGDWHCRCDEHKRESLTLMRDGHTLTSEQLAPFGQSLVKASVERARARGEI